MSPPPPTEGAAGAILVPNPSPIVPFSSSIPFANVRTTLLPLSVRSEKGPSAASECDFSGLISLNLVSTASLIAPRSAERDYYKHIHKGLIESKKLGQHDSVVWLAFIPKTNNIIKPHAIDLKTTEYYRISNSLIKIIEKRKCLCGGANSADLQESKGLDSIKPPEYKCVCGAVFGTVEELGKHRVNCTEFQIKQSAEVRKILEDGKIF